MATRPRRAVKQTVSYAEELAAQEFARRAAMQLTQDNEEFAEDSDDDEPMPSAAPKPRAPRAPRAPKNPKNMSWLFEACMDAKKLKNKDYDLDAAAEAWVVEYAANAGKGAGPAS